MVLVLLVVPVVGNVDVLVADEVVVFDVVEVVVCAVVGDAALVVITFRTTWEVPFVSCVLKPITAANITNTASDALRMTAALSLKNSFKKPFIFPPGCFVVWTQFV